MVSIDPDSAIADISEKSEEETHVLGQQHGIGDVVNKENDADPEKEEETQSVSFVSDLIPPHFSATTTPPTDMVVDLVQQLIDTMKCYRQKLMEKKASFTDVQTLINKMATQSESLSLVSRQLSLADSLRSIVNQSLILSSAEIVTFNSGMYNGG